MLIITLVSLWLASTGTEDVFHNLSRFDALNSFLLGGFVGIWNGRPEDVLDHTSRKAFDEELDGLRVRKMIARNSSEAFEVIRVLVDFRPLQPEGLQLCSGTLLTLGVLVLGRKFREELLPDSWDIVDWLESVNPFSHGSGPFSNEWSLDEREGESDSLDVRPHARYLSVESNVRFQLVDEVVGIHAISGEDRW